jgi:hypothetical protein
MNRSRTHFFTVEVGYRARELYYYEKTRNSFD